MELIFLGFLNLSPITPGRFGLTFVLFSLAFLLYFGAVKCLPGRDVGEVEVLAFAFFFRLTVFFVPPFASDDINRYVWDGRVQNAGVNPYRYAPEAPELAFLRDANYDGIRSKSVRTIYPPLSEVLFRAAARISPEVWVQKLAFIFFDVATIILLLFYLDWRGRPPSWALVYAWNPLVLLEFSSSGHHDALGIFFLMSGIFLLEKTKNAAGMSALAASFLATFTSILVVPWILWRSRFRKYLWTFLAVSLIGYLPFWRGFFPWERAMALVAGAGTYFKDWCFNASVYAVLSAFFHNGLMLEKILLVILAAAGFWLARILDNLLAYVGLMVSAALIVSPVVYPWHVCWLLPFLCFYPFWSGILWSALVCLSYVVLSVYANTQSLVLSGWVPWIEYGVVFSFLIMELMRWRRRQASRGAVVA